MNYILNLIVFLLFFAGFVYFGSNTEEDYYEYLRYGFLLLSFVPLLYIFVDFKAGKLPKQTKDEQRQERHDKRSKVRKRRKDSRERIRRLING